MKILLICPIPAEFGACRETLLLRELSPLMSCRAGRAMAGGIELIAVESGPAKARAAAATTAACIRYGPDLVIDTGTCCGLEPAVPYGEIIQGEACCEYDIGGEKIPVRLRPEMDLPSGFSFLDPQVREDLQRRSVELGQEGGFPVRIGTQACGEVLIRSIPVRQHLYRLIHAAGGNWETAGVFIGALRSGKPPISLRIVSDLGDQNAQSDFRRNVRASSRQLYRYIGLLLETGWFLSFHDQWSRLPAETMARVGSAVRP